MGRAFAQFASLMHEAAHRLLFSNKRANDLVGRWLLGYPSFTSTDAYRRVHMAHHRDEFGPDEPDIPLYIGYPIAHASFRRKLVRDATGRTGMQADARPAAPTRARRTSRSRRDVLEDHARSRPCCSAAAIASGHWWLYPLFWVAPYLTVWRVINRLRSVAEHGGMQRSPDRRESTHSVRQHPVARFLLVPYRIGWHLAHHVDSGVPFRNLPMLHDALREAGYVDDSFEYASYPAIWACARGPNRVRRHTSPWRPSMHEWDDDTNLFAHSVIGYAIERLQLPKDPHWGAHPADELAAALGADDHARRRRRARGAARCSATC